MRPGNLQSLVLNLSIKRNVTHSAGSSIRSSLTHLQEMNMKNRRAFRLLLVLLAFLSLTLHAAEDRAPKIIKVDPPNWWAGMPKPFLLVRGEHLTGSPLHAQRSSTPRRSSHNPRKRTLGRTLAQRLASEARNHHYPCPKRRRPIRSPIQLRAETIHTTQLRRLFIPRCDVPDHERSFRRRRSRQRRR